MSNLYNVPVETLRRRVNGSVSLGCKPGPATILTDEEEDLLCKYIIELADMGYGLSKEDVQRLAFSLVEKMGRKHPFTNGMAGRGWFDGFKARHPQLSFRTPQALSFTRAVSANELAISDFFAKLGGLYGRLNLINKPMQIFNADETGVSVVHKQGKVLAQLGRRHVSTITSAEKGKTHTVLSCISAVGQVLPPMIVYPRKQRVPDSLKNDCVPDTYFACSGNGWINSELYLEWFKFFLKHISPTRPVLLVQDGHSSHISISLIELARENDVHLLCLPAHTTHILQPLDVGVFKSFKSNFSKVCHRYLIERPGQVITSAAIASLVHGAWFNSFTPVNIMSGFKKCGVYPLNPGEVSDRQLAPSRVAVQCESSDGSIKSNAQERKSTEYETVPESVSSQSSSNSSKTFTIEQLKLFQQRYNEGYDVKDPEYETWLKIHHPEIGTPPVGSSSSASDKSSIDVMKELLILPSKVQKKQNPLSGKSVCITENHVLEQLKAKEAEKLRIAEERKIKMDERAKQKEARQIEKERKAMEREEKVKKKDKQKKEKQRAIKKPTGRKEILNLGDKDNTQCSFCEVFYQDDVTGDSWQGIQLILIMESDKNAQIYVCGCDWEAMNLDEFKSQLHPLDKQPNTNLVEKHGKLIDDERHETTWQVDELVDDVEDGEVKESEEENEQGKSNCDNKRRIYERDFLLSLQFLEQCKQRPLNLGNAAYIRKVPLQPSDIQVGLSCHDNISGAGRKKKSRYIMPSRKKRKLHTNNEQAGLENAEEHWEEMDTHELFRKLVEILDQLTAQNVEILADQIIQLPINSEDRLKGCVDRIFNVAIEQDKLSVACAQLSKILSSKLIKIETGCQGKRITFYNLLLAKCRQEFGKDKKSDIVVVELMKKIEEAATPVEKKELEKELSEKKYQLQSNYLGNIKFIGELFKVKIVSIKLIHKYIKRLLQSTTDEEALEGFAKLMLTMGRLLKNKERDKVLIKQYMDRVRIIIAAGKISSRIICLLLDVGKHIKHRLLSRTTPPILPAQQFYMQEQQPLHYATGITPIPSSLHLHQQPYQGIAAHQYYPPQPQMTPVYLDTTALLDHSPLLETSTYLHHFSDHQRQPYTAMAPPASHSARAKPPKIVDPLAMKEVETSKIIKSDLHQLLQNISLISGDCNYSEL